jgi:cytoskeletal protein CcmA (bactofilin family)
LKEIQMALQSPFFGKRDNEPTGLRHGSPNPNPYSNASSAPAAANTPNVAAATAQSATATSSGAAPREPGGSKLTVGPNIKLKGVEITDCDTLVVEGLVEATMDSRVMQIAERGAFKGSAEIDIAEIHGEFDGNLTVRQKLVIFATGKVTGKIRYGKLVIEEGGQLAGEILFGAVSGAKAALVPKPGLQAA